MGKYLEAEKRLNGSFGFLEVDGDEIAEVEGVEITISVEYTDVWRGMDKDAKMTGRSGEGKFKFKKAFSRMKPYIEAVKAGKTPKARIVAWVADPDVGGKEERIAISTVKLTSLSAPSFDRGTLTDVEVPFRFAPGDLEYLDSIDPE